jgi:hypothetical protein
MERQSKDAICHLFEILPGVAVGDDVSVSVQAPTNSTSISKVIIPSNTLALATLSP